MNAVRFYVTEEKKLVLTTELVSGIRRPIDFETWELEVFGPVPAALHHVLKDEPDTNSFF